MITKPTGSTIISTATHAVIAAATIPAIATSSITTVTGLKELSRARMGCVPSPMLLLLLLVLVGPSRTVLAASYCRFPCFREHAACSADAECALAWAPVAAAGCDEAFCGSTYLASTPTASASATVYNNLVMCVEPCLQGRPKGCSQCLIEEMKCQVDGDCPLPGANLPALAAVDQPSGNRSSVSYVAYHACADPVITCPAVVISEYNVGLHRLQFSASGAQGLRFVSLVDETDETPLLVDQKDFRADICQQDWSDTMTVPLRGGVRHLVATVQDLRGLSASCSWDLGVIHTANAPATVLQVVEDATTSRGNLTTASLDRLEIVHQAALYVAGTHTVVANTTVAGLHTTTHLLGRAVGLALAVDTHDIQGTERGLNATASVFAAFDAVQLVPRTVFMAAHEGSATMVAAMEKYTDVVWRSLPAAGIVSVPLNLTGAVLSLEAIHMTKELLASAGYTYSASTTLYESADNTTDTSVPNNASITDQTASIQTITFHVPKEITKHCNGDGVGLVFVQTSDDSAFVSKGASLRRTTGGVSHMEHVPEKIFVLVCQGSGWFRNAAVR